MRLCKTIHFCVGVIAGYILSIILCRNSKVLRLILSFNITLSQNMLLRSHNKCPLSKPRLLSMLYTTFFPHYFDTFDHRINIYKVSG